MNLKECHNFFASRKTQNNSARRRHSREEDIDGYLFDFNSPFRLDFDKISLSKALRRMAHKTQVFPKHVNCHTRTRLTHTMEVCSIANNIARILGLNDDLCQAISLGHDIGHTPFGHDGEKFLSKESGKIFRHEKFAIAIAQEIERKGEGLNLTKQVLEGILFHSRGPNHHAISKNVSFEANVVMLSDKLAYTWADINDIFFRTNFFSIEDFPKIFELLKFFGKNQREWVHRSIENLCLESCQKGEISFSDSEAGQIFSEIKKQMYEIYSRIRPEYYMKSLKFIYEYLLNSKISEGIDPVVIIALMTDDDVLNINQNKEFVELSLLASSVGELIPGLRSKKVDWEKPDISW